MKSREQELIDICFQLVLVATEKQHRKFFNKLDNEGKAKWVAEQLEKCGFKTYPCGASWGILEKYEKEN